MSEFLYNIDVQLFYFLNKTLANNLFDKFFPFITDLDHWKIFFVIMWLYLLIGAGKKGRIVAFLALFLVFITDQTSSNLIKNLAERIRPCNVLPGVHVLVSCTESFSFPSSHAVNYFGGAVLFSHFFPRFKITFFIVASLEALSRVICGVHYPSDIIVGTIIGLVIGWLFVLLWKQINKKFKILKD